MQLLRIFFLSPVIYLLNFVKCMEIMDSVWDSSKFSNPIVTHAALFELGPGKQVSLPYFSRKLQTIPRTLISRKYSWKAIFLKATLSIPLYLQSGSVAVSLSHEGCGPEEKPSLSGNTPWTGVLSCERAREAAAPTLPQRETACVPARSNLRRSTNFSFTLKYTVGFKQMSVKQLLRVAEVPTSQFRKKWDRTKRKCSFLVMSFQGYKGC